MNMLGLSGIKNQVETRDSIKSNKSFKSVIFGCGNYGKMVFNFLGVDNVDCFCDNNPNIVGDSLMGCPIISYKDLLDMYHSENTLIILGINNFNAGKVAEQLESDGIFDFVFCDYLPGFGSNPEISDEDFEKFSDKNFRLEFSIKYMRKMLDDKNRELKYLKEHSDIRSMKPATGKQREIQLQCVKNTQEVLAFLNENCPVKCWITGGTLIGKLRHDGFVPWDTDIDFGIMREDVCKLMDFFTDYSTVVIPGISDGLDKAAKIYKGKYFLFIGEDYIRIFTCKNGERIIMLEAFPFDYYIEDMTLADYSKFTSEASVYKKQSSGCKDWYVYCQDKLKNSGYISETPTNKIMPGIDSFIYRGLWNIEFFLNYDMIFPLHEVEFEGGKFLCVNRPEEYIRYEYPNWEGFPSRIPPLSFNE